MRIIVCGDRNWTDYKLILRTLKGLEKGPHTIIDGKAPGADSLGHKAALALKWPYKRFRAEWEKYGLAAGPIRNERMKKEGKPDLVLAFHDDLEHSKGTKHMVSIAEKANVKVMRVKHEGRTI